MTKTYKKRNKMRKTKKYKKRKCKRKTNKKKMNKKKTHKMRGGEKNNESILRLKFESWIKKWVHKEPTAVVKNVRKKLPTRYFKHGKNYKNPLNNIFSQILGSLMNPMASLNKVQDDMKKQLKEEANKMKTDMTF